jgi:hypothetical protein
VWQPVGGFEHLGCSLRTMHVIMETVLACFDQGQLPSFCKYTQPYVKHLTA